MEHHMGLVARYRHDDGIGNASGLQHACEIVTEVVRPKIADAGLPTES